MIRIGFWGPLCYIFFFKEPQNSIGNYSGPYSSPPSKGSEGLGLRVDVGIQCTTTQAEMRKKLAPTLASALIQARRESP